MSEGLWTQQAATIECFDEPLPRLSPIRHTSLVAFDARMLFPQVRRLQLAAALAADIPDRGLLRQKYEA
jgi:hypothetical protein